MTVLLVQLKQERCDRCFPSILFLFWAMKTKSKLPYESMNSTHIFVAAFVNVTIRALASAELPYNTTNQQNRKSRCFSGSTVHCTIMNFYNLNPNDGKSKKLLGIPKLMYKV